MIGGINYAVAQIKSHNHIGIINVGFTRLPINAVTQAVEKAVAANIPVIVPAGDAHEDACLYAPSNSHAAIVVAAVDRQDRPLLGNFGKCVDIFAPGSAIKTAWIGKNASNRTYHAFGSSFAAAHVTGIAALLLGIDKTLTPARLSEMIMNISTANVVQGINDDTPNRLAFNRRTQFQRISEIPANY